MTLMNAAAKIMTADDICGCDCYSDSYNSVCNGYDSCSNYYGNIAPPTVTLRNAAAKIMTADDICSCDCYSDSYNSK
eukprot:15324071-Ditylum_brightwellii.AAC.1